MNQITPFIFENQQVRTVQRDGEPWFVVADVCAALCVKNTAQAVDILDPDEKGMSSTDTPGGRQEMLIVSESGLYTLILRSRKATTPGTIQHRFRRWITSEVLPTIRKTGGYRIQDEGTASVIDQAHRYSVHEAIVRPDGQWGRVWAIPVYRIDGLDYWNVHIILDAYCGLKHVPEDVKAHENARDLIALHPELAGGGPLWVARPKGLEKIILRAGGCWDDRANRFMQQIVQAEQYDCENTLPQKFG